MALLTILPLWSILLTALDEGGAWSDRNTHGGCDQGLAPLCPSTVHPAWPHTHLGPGQLFADLSPEELEAMMGF